MFENWKIDNKNVLPPLESDRIKIDLTYKKGTLAEAQPVLNFDRLTLSNDSKDAYLCAEKKGGPYKRIPVSYSYDNRTMFDGYLTDAEFFLNEDQIDVKPVSNQSTDGLSEKLSAIEASLLENDYKYEDLDFIIEKTEIREDLIQLSLSTIFYSYLLYTQIKETARLIHEAVEAAGNAAGFSFGSAAALVLNLAAQVIFLATTLAAVVKNLKELKELFFPKKRTTRVISLYELCRAPLEKIGYKFITDIPDMKKVFHWSSGDVNNSSYYPRSSDVCGSALGAINFVIKKFSARVFVKDNTVYIVDYYSNLFFNGSGYKLKSFPKGNYRRNLSDMYGTREHIYSVDYQDKWTLRNFKGTEYKIRANIDDATKSTVVGLKQRNMGVALCNRKNKLNELEKAWMNFARLANKLLSEFSGSAQVLRIPDRTGVAKISSDTLSVAKVLWKEGKKIPANHREELSAKADEHKFHWVESHVRNPRAKKKIYGEREPVLQAYTGKSLSCNLNNNIVFTDDGTPGEMISVSWEKSRDNAELVFEIEDVDRETKLVETFSEPIK